MLFRRPAAAAIALAVLGAAPAYANPAALPAIEPCVAALPGAPAVAGCEPATAPSDAARNPGAQRPGGLTGAGAIQIQLHRTMQNASPRSQAGVTPPPQRQLQRRDIESGMRRDRMNVPPVPTQRRPWFAWPAVPAPDAIANP